MQRQQQQQQMGCSGGVGGGGGGGLSRFRSAPATWFENLLQEDEEPQNQTLPQLPNLRNSSIYDPTTFFDPTSFTRHNSSPPELLAQLTSHSPTLPSDDYFSNSDYDLLSILDMPTSKRPRESESTQQSKAEQSSSFSNMEMDQLFQDSVPCRVRAKRGCATHPRSIAERVRRTRISDRIRKLQELVPNMDKQTNTADMLDEAVEYVKFLQKQIQELTEHQKNCKCSNRE